MYIYLCAMRDNEANHCFIQYITNDIERNRCPSHESFINQTTKKTTPMYHFGSQHSYQSLVAICFFIFALLPLSLGIFETVRMINTKYTH